MRSLLVVWGLTVMSSRVAVGAVRPPLAPPLFFAPFAKLRESKVSVLSARQHWPSDTIVSAFCTWGLALHLWSRNPPDPADDGADISRDLLADEPAQQPPGGQRSYERERQSCDRPADR